MVNHSDYRYDGGGLVVSTGGYSGGGFTNDPFAWFVSAIDMHPRILLGVVIVLIIMLVISAVTRGFAPPPPIPSGYVNGLHPNTGKFRSGASDSILGFEQRNRADEMARSGFMGSRDAPYFSDVTNRVLRMENREKDAVRALGKINQERLRRASEDTMGTNPLPWGPFWKEWQETHVMDGEDVPKEAFSYSDSM
jgi:hypothetical protein